MKKIIFIFILFGLVSCAYQNTKEDMLQNASSLEQDVFPFRGNYSWSFNLMGAKQISSQSFYGDKIEFKMTGKIHSTEYSMTNISYDASEGKWIGESKDKIIYVLFFKNKTENTITIYKHKCKTNGLEEAIAFTVPDADATSDHGWNVYSLNGKDSQDALPFVGVYSNKLNQIEIDNHFINYENKQIRKMSYHFGERRWVGEFQNRYLLVFFENTNDPNSLPLYTAWFEDIEAAYKMKYNTIKSEMWEKYEKS